MSRGNPPSRGNRGASNPRGSQLPRGQSQPRGGISSRGQPSARGPYAPRAGLPVRGVIPPRGGFPLRGTSVPRGGLPSRGSPAPRGRFSSHGTSAPRGGAPPGRQPLPPSSTPSPAAHANTSATTPVHPVASQPRRLTLTEILERMEQQRLLLKQELQQKSQQVNERPGSPAASGSAPQLVVGGTPMQPAKRSSKEWFEAQLKVAEERIKKSSEQDNKRPCSPEASAPAQKKPRLESPIVTDNTQQSTPGHPTGVTVDNSSTISSAPAPTVTDSEHPLLATPGAEQLRQSPEPGPVNGTPAADPDVPPQLDAAVPDAVSNAVASRPASVHPNPALIQTEDAVKQQRLDDSWKSAMRNDWLPQRGNPDIGVHRLLWSFFSGPDSKLSDRTCFMDKAGVTPRFELAVRDLMTLFTQCQLTNPMMEALVSTYCSINYTTDRGHVAVPKHMNDVYAAARDQIFQGLAQRGHLPFRPEEDVVNVCGVANEGSGHWIAFHIDRDQKLAKVVDSMMPKTEDGRRDTTNRMKTFLDRMASVEGAHASWLSTLGQWQVSWADEAYQQQNSDDGSIHALQNFADMMHRGEVKRFHDADIIRQRLGLRLNRNLAEGADSWAVVNPFEDELHELWKDRQATVKRESGTVIKTEPVE